MAKESTRKAWLAKSSLAAVTVAAASFSITGFASATSWSHDNSDSKKKYVNSYDWKDYSWDKKDHKNDNKHNKHGYDYKKHGDKKYAESKHDYNKHDKHDDKKDDYKKDYGHKDNGYVKHASWDDKKDYGHDKKNYGNDNYEKSYDKSWSNDNSWNDWNPETWQKSGKSYGDWHSGFKGHLQTHGDHKWGNGGNGGYGDWAYSESESWGHDWNNWNPQTWSDNGYSHAEWQNHVSKFLKDHHPYWSSNWSNNDHNDYGKDKHGWAEKADYQKDKGNHGSKDQGHYSDYGDNYCDNKSEGHDRSDNEQWGHDYDKDRGNRYYSEERSYESKYELTNDTDVNVDNNVTQHATSGDANSEDNSGGGDVTSGNASNVAETSTIVSVDNTAANAQHNGSGSSSSSYSQSYGGNDWDEEGDSYTSIVERTSDERTINNITNVEVNNTINQYAVSGDADSEDNYWGGSVQSGDATNTARTVNYVVVRN